MSAGYHNMVPVAATAAHHCNNSESMEVYNNTLRTVVPASTYCSSSPTTLSSEITTETSYPTHAPSSPSCGRTISADGAGIICGSCVAVVAQQQNSTPCHVHECVPSNITSTDAASSSSSSSRIVVSVAHPVHNSNNTKSKMLPSACANVNTCEQQHTMPATSDRNGGSHTTCVNSSCSLPIRDTSPSSLHGQKEQPSSSPLSFDPTVATMTTIIPADSNYWNDPISFSLQRYMMRCIEKRSRITTSALYQKLLDRNRLAGTPVDKVMLSRYLYDLKQRDCLCANPCPYIPWSSPHEQMVKNWYVTSETLDNFERYMEQLCSRQQHTLFGGQRLRAVVVVLGLKDALEPLDAFCRHHLCKRNLAHVIMLDTTGASSQTTMTSSPPACSSNKSSCNNRTGMTCSSSAPNAAAITTTALLCDRIQKVLYSNEHAPATLLPHSTPVQPPCASTTPTIASSSSSLLVQQPLVITLDQIDATMPSLVAQHGSLAIKQLLLCMMHCILQTTQSRPCSPCSSCILLVSPGDMDWSLEASILTKCYQSTTTTIHVVRHARDLKHYFAL